MNDFYALQEKLRNQLVEVYRQLSPQEQQIVQLFSIIYEPIARSIFVKCVRQSAIKDDNRKLFTALTLKPFIDALIAQEILIQEINRGPQCHPLLAEIATRDAIKQGNFNKFVDSIEITLPIPMSWNEAGRRFDSPLQLIREVRIGIYRQDVEFINKQLKDYHKYSYYQNKISLREILASVLANPFDEDWFLTLPEPLQQETLETIVVYDVLALSSRENVFAFLRKQCKDSQKNCSDFFYSTYTEQLILQGKLEEAQQTLNAISGQNSSQRAVLQGWLHFLRGEQEAAIANYETALTILKKGTKKRNVYIKSLGGLFFILALLKDGSPKRLQQGKKYATIAKGYKNELQYTYILLEAILEFQLGNLAKKEFIVSECYEPYPDLHSLDYFVSALCLYWIDVKKAKRYFPKKLEPLYEQAEASGYYWLGTELAELLARLKLRNSKQAEVLQKHSDTVTLADLIRPKDAWELSLQALVNLTGTNPQLVQSNSQEQRLVWFLTLYNKTWILQPRAQKINGKGQWSKGRPIALKRLQKSLDEFPYLTHQDLKVCAQIKTFDHGYYRNTEYTFNEKAIAALVGHPLVFWEDNPKVRVEIVKGEPELIVEKTKGNWLTLKLSPEIPKEEKILVIKETPTRLKIIEVNSEHRRIAEIIGSKNKLQVPSTAQERVLAAINAVSSLVTVQSDIGGGLADVEAITADSTPHLHLLPAGEGLKAALLSCPFPQGGSYYRPGMGGETVIAEVEGKRLQTTRNLSEEKQLAQDIVTACPTLANHAEEDGEWHVEDPENCLELLLELQSLDSKVVMEWPEGEKFRVSHQADLNSFRLNLKRQRDWFAVSGELKLGDDLVLDMQNLLDLLERTPTRFIPLGDGQFVALTKAFRKRLDELRAFSEKQGNRMRVHPLATFALEEMVDEVGTLKADKHWKSHVKKLKEAQNLQPQLPSTLQAELRDYQIEGFQWLARLAHWGVGACLADDMGLGKTLQALAVILTRAPEGASLVIAPTSVCLNWISEVQRFAPTLKVKQLGSGDRQKVIDQLESFDLLICSYGLLQQEEVSKMFEKVQWQTIVLDEAQAIKNMATKRSQAAMKLQGGFKLITTGTPIENHLGELWNLFRFINPGLLSSLDQFNQRFAYPIEKNQDKSARQHLKKLIQPFILRRTKTEVLEELPSRTEILLHVELSEAEMALYEALRRDAIAKLEETDAQAGHKHLQVLAEIMKLRRVCCNPRLVMPDTPLESSKLNLFGEVLGELLANRHKALVFSQFVAHLHIIRDYLDQKKISYQYLDGSTPAKERQKSVEAFQGGQGDVFLISLKAGGTGLNLTAADYVIHMDPWWNPAVEDQASDRAHRIGQQRPVTIYRLVAKETIEDKIVDLHRHKRDLADSLLEGTDMSGKISTEELLKLIHET